MSLEATLKEINRDFGAGSISTLSAAPRQELSVIPTGALTLDLALGCGGVPRGRIVEIFGPESSGKTTLAQHIMAQAQKLDLRCAMVDAEHAFDPAYARALGVDPDALLFNQPDYGEQGLDIALRLIESGEVGLVVVDSVAALTPKSEIDGDMGHLGVGGQARMMGQAMRKMTAAASRTQTCVIFINQIREKVGVMFGSPETQPGGRALKFQASQRLDIRRLETYKVDGEPTGNKVKVKVVKNKTGAPFTEAFFDIEFGTGISTAGCLLDVGLACGALKGGGGRYALASTGEALPHGRAKAIQALRDDPELFATFDGEVRKELGL